ncbi:hypothetical protein [Sorangium sp. So ce861]|uniref:hypothetical protein n=1 Tax=Sorangium sp. So ce861 TaxID=3133323 RepID=UPI003F61CDCC
MVIDRGRSIVLRDGRAYPNTTDVRRRPTPDLGRVASARTEDDGGPIENFGAFGEPGEFDELKA